MVQNVVFLVINYKFEVITCGFIIPLAQDKVFRKYVGPSTRRINRPCLSACPRPVHCAEPTPANFGPHLLEGVLQEGGFAQS